MQADNHYDIIDPTNELVRKSEYAVYAASHNYEEYLQRHEGETASHQEVVVKTSSRFLDPDEEVPKSQVEELVYFLRNQGTPGFPDVLHWVVAFHLPSNESGALLPLAAYKGYYDKNRKWMKNPTERDSPFVIDSHRFNEPKKQVHNLWLLTKPSDKMKWREFEFAPYPGIRSDSHFRALNIVLRNPECIVDCVYYAIPKNQMPAKW